MNIKDIFDKAENGTLTYEQFTELCGQQEVAPKFADLTEGKYVGKGKYEDDIKAKDVQIESLNTTIATRDNDLVSLQEKLNAAGDDTAAYKALSGDFDNLKVKYENETKALNEQLAKQAYEYAVRDFSGKQNFSSDAAKRDFISQLNAKQLTVENGTIIGAEDFLNMYRADNANAFVQDKAEPTPKQPIPTITQPSQPTAQGGDDNVFNFSFLGVRGKDK